MCPYIYDFTIDFIFNYIVNFIINLTIVFELQDYHLANLEVATSWLQTIIYPYQQPALWVVRQRALVPHSTGVTV